MELDFLETKNKVMLYIYTTTLTKEDIELINSKKMRVGANDAINFYKDVNRILCIKKYSKRIEIELEKKEPCTWYTLNGPREEKLGLKEVCNLVSDDEEMEYSGDSALNLVSKIYRTSDDDVKKAMEKSFIESQGTVLSTDWNEVKNKKIEPKK